MIQLESAYPYQQVLPDNDFADLSSLPHYRCRETMPGQIQAVFCQYLFNLCNPANIARTLQGKVTTHDTAQLSSLSPFQDIGERGKYFSYQGKITVGCSVTGITRCVYFHCSWFSFENIFVGNIVDPLISCC